MSPKVKSKTMEELVKRTATTDRKIADPDDINYAILPNAPPSGFAHSEEHKVPYTQNLPAE